MQQDDPLLTVRYAKGKNPIRIILDSHGTIKDNSRIIKTCKRVPTIIVVSELVSKSNLNRLRKLPIDVIVCGKNQVRLQRRFCPIVQWGIGGQRHLNSNVSTCWSTSRSIFNDNFLC